jgi:serine protease Do
MIRETRSGREVKIEIRRGSATQTITVRVAQRKAPRAEWGDGGAIPGHLEIRMPDFPRGIMQMRSLILGMEAEPIDGQLAQYFGVKEGVLVRSVSRGSAAEKAGIRAGDVILKFEDARVATSSDIASHLSTLHGKSAPVVLMRDHKELTVALTVSEDDPARIQITPFQVNPHQF